MEAGRELDALVAEKVMGWHKEQLRDPVAGPELYWCDDSVGIQIVDSWKPSTSIHFAWMVVGLLAAKGYALALQAPGSTDMNECYRQFDQWTADFFPSSSITEAQADTAPLAICLAALKAVGYQFYDKEHVT